VVAKAHDKLRVFTGGDLSDVVNQVNADTFEGDVDDLIDALSLPAFMLEESI
jgi:hypothetical protein